MAELDFVPRLFGACKTMVDHVFILHTHTDPHQVARLSGILSRACQDCFILISHDRNASHLDTKLLPNDRLAIVPGDGGRGDFAIVDGYLAALSWLSSNKISYNWVSNLSGQDYPVASLNMFRRRCEEATGVDAFIHYFDAFDIDSKEMAPWSWEADEGMRRYHYRYKRLLPELSTFQRALVKPWRQALHASKLKWHINPSYGLMVGRFAASTPFGPNFRCYAGSFWTTINARSADAVLAFVANRPDVVAYFRSVLIPDEAFVQTVLANDRSLRLINNNLRYIDMRASRHGRPKILTENDLPAIRSSGAFFARKFDSKQYQLFQTLDEYAAA